MATTTRYDHTLKLVGDQSIDYTNLKVMLLNNHTFDSTHTTMTNITGDEVSGNGWTAGGEAITNAAWTQVNTNDGRLDGDDISVTASGGPIGPANAHVVYDATNNLPLIYVAYSGDEEAGKGTDFKVTFANTGLLELTA